MSEALTQLPVAMPEVTSQAPSRLPDSASAIANADEFRAALSEQAGQSPEWATAIVGQSAQINEPFQALGSKGFLKGSLAAPLPSPDSLAEISLADELQQSLTGPPAGTLRDALSAATQSSLSSKPGMVLSSPGTGSPGEFPGQVKGLLPGVSPGQVSGVQNPNNGNSFSGAGTPGHVKATQARAPELESRMNSIAELPSLSTAAATASQAAQSAAGPLASVVSTLTPSAGNTPTPRPVTAASESNPLNISKTTEALGYQSDLSRSLFASDNSLPVSFQSSAGLALNPETQGQLQPNSGQSAGTTVSFGPATTLTPSGSVTSPQDLTTLAMLDKGPLSSQLSGQLSGHVTGQVADQVKVMIRADQREAQLLLHPRELGAVNIRIALHADQADVAIEATNPELYRELASSMPKLRQLFLEEGMGLSQLALDMGQFQEHQNTGDDPQPRHPSALSQLPSVSNNSLPKPSIALPGTLLGEGQTLDLYA